MSESRIYLQIYQLSAEKQRLEVQIGDWIQRKGELEAQLEGVQQRIAELKRHLPPEQGVPASVRTAATKTPLDSAGALNVIEY